MSARRDALRNYLKEVARDLLGRGIVRRNAGQSLDQIVWAELPRIALELKEDLRVLVSEAGDAVVASGMIEAVVQKKVSDLVGAGMRALGGALGRGRR